MLVQAPGNDTSVLLVRQSGSNQSKIAYMMSRFPRLTETFVLFEMLALQNLGIDVELYPLLREHTTVMHPEAKPLVERAHYQPFLSIPILSANLRRLWRNPFIYLATLWSVLRGTWGSMNFFLGAIGIFPKSVYFAELMAAEEIQHLHAHFANHPATAAYIIHRLTGIPYSFTAHGSDLHVDRHMLCEKVANAEFVVAISNYNRDLIIEECGEHIQNKTVVIHCGIDTQVFYPREGSKSASCVDTFTILCTGTLHEVKGQTYLIEACRLLQEQGINFTCNFVGDGEDREKLAVQIAKSGLSHCVQLLGRRTREEIAELLACSDVVVAPSVPTSAGKREGIPVVLMEAMGSGVPVIASHLSGIPELVDHEQSGLLVPPRDAQALFEALRRMHGDLELRHRLGQCGRAKVIQDFDVFSNARLLAQRFGGRK